MLAWFQQIDKATAIAEVVAIARDYFASWSPEELGRLPAACRPGRIRGAADIEALHECAVDAFRTTRASGDELKALQLITSFLVRASLRIVQLQASAEGEPPAMPKHMSNSRDL
jgi:hypothetical protein